MQTPLRLDWDDLRVFHAVAELGSTKRAAKALCIDQTTCARRINSLERATGMKLFDRSAAGFALTADGKRLRVPATEMARGADAIALLAGQHARANDAVVRLSVGDLLVEPVVHPALREFRRQWPGVRVDLAVESRRANILHGEADVAIRAGPPTDEPSLIVRRLSDNPHAVYCTAAYIERHDAPTTIAEFVARPFGCVEGLMVRLITEYFPDRRPSFVASGLQPLVEAVASGELAAILPDMHASTVPNLVKCFAIEADTGAVWLVYHPALRGHAYSRDLLRLITKSFGAWAKAAQSGAPSLPLDQSRQV